ncbi:MAG: hypothetical protein FWF44_01980 [Defluviitaleaceae bacterium]|nr:hypothetical protein [Defluviitaleaceae bacterium]
MSYEELFRGLVEGLLEVIEKYAKEWERLESGIQENIKMNGHNRTNSDMPENPIIYPAKKPNKGNNRLIL